MAFAITCFLRFCLCFFIWLVFSALLCFYAAGARGLERLEKKRQRKRLGRDAYFVSARTFSFQDPSLLLVKWSAEGKRVTLETRLVQSTKIVE